MNKRFILNLSIFSLLVCQISAAGELSKAKKAFAEKKYMTLDAKESTLRYFLHKLSVPREMHPVSYYFLPQKSVQLRMVRSDGTSHTIKFEPRTVTFHRSANAKLKLPAKNISLSGAVLSLTGLPLDKIYIKPDLEKISDEELLKMDLSKFPDAAKTLVNFRILRDKEHNIFYINGSYAGKEKAAPFINIEAYFNPGSSMVLDLTQEKEEQPSLFEPINMEMRAENGIPVKWKKKDTSLQIPLRTDITNAIDLFNARAVTPFRSYLNKDLARSAFDGLPTSFLFSVPAKQYNRAYVLCAVLPRKEALPAFRFVMTRYAPYGRPANAMVTQEVDLFRPAENIRKYGEAEMIFEGKKVTVPVYLAEIELDHGKIQDYIFYEKKHVLPFSDYLDIDLQGPGKRSVKEKKRSSLAVLAITLETSPVKMFVGQSVPGNIFEQKKDPFTVPVDLTGMKKGKYTLKWQTLSLERNPEEKSEKSFELNKGERKRFLIPVSHRKRGYYSLDISLYEGKEKISAFESAFVVLPPDTRKATWKDSPYGTWFWGNSHNLAPSVDIFGPVLQKVGIRSVGCSDMVPYQQWKKYGIIFSQFRNEFNKIYTDKNLLSNDPLVWKKMEKDLIKKVDEYVKNNPDCKYILLFHESYPGEYEFIPPTLLGKEAKKYDEKREKLEMARVKGAMQYCRIIRKNFPHLKIILGNSCYAQGLIEALGARKFDPSLVDYIGCEGVGSWGLYPEYFSTWNPDGSSYILRATARKNGFTQKITGCFEWACRTSNHTPVMPVKDPLESMKRQAEYLMRDAMVGHAYSYRQISLSSPTDTNTAYNDGEVYGGVGMMTRQYIPKPLAAAIATHTRIMDQVKFVKRVDSSSDIYLFELTRKDGKNIYALWTVKGSAKCRILLSGKEKNILSEDLYGREKFYTVKGNSFETEATNSIRYFVTENKFGALETLERKFAFDAPADPLKTLEFSSSDLVRVKEKDFRIDGRKPNAMTFQAVHQVDSSLTDVTDREKGKVVSVKFDLSTLPQDDWIHGGYTMYRFKKPIVIPQDADGVGIWVKGNESFGRFAWEVRDSRGNSFISNGEPDNGAGILNMMYENELDFGCWRFLHMALTPLMAKPANWFGLQWHGKGAIRTPKMITGMLLSSSNKLPGIFELKKVKNQEIRLGKILFFSAGKSAAGERKKVLDTVSPEVAAAGLTGEGENVSDGELIKNGSFEILSPASPEQLHSSWDIADAAKFPSYWMVHPVPGTRRGNLRIVPGVTGKNALRLEGRYVCFKQKLPSGVAGKKLAVSFRGRNTGLIAILLMGENFISMKKNERINSPATANWKEKHGFIDVPANIKNPYIVIQQGASKGWIEIDELKVKIDSSGK